jgi:hypothetical protein
MEIAWESELAGLLNELSAVQDELLEFLAAKRRLLVNVDTAGLAAMQPREEELTARLQACHQYRTRLLQRAAAEGLPSDSIQSLTSSLPRSQREGLGKQVKMASARARLLQHHSLSNWVLVQKTLLHLSQVLEIIATGGRLQPTYGKGQSSGASGALVDQAA